MKYTGDETNVVVKSSYDKNDTTYNTVIASNEDSSEDYMFANNTTIETVDFEEGISTSGNISNMFTKCTSLKKVNLSNVDLTNVSNVDNTFSGCTSLEEVKVDATKDIPSSVNSNNMFTGSSITNTTKTINGIEVGPESELENWNYTLDEDNGIISISAAIKSCSNPVLYAAYNYNNKIYHTNVTKRFSFNGSKAINIVIKPDVIVERTSIASMFADCPNLEEIKGLENLDTSNVTDMCGSFMECSSLTSLDVSSFDTSKCTDMNMMFNECGSLTSLDLTSFDTSNVTDMNSMFMDCSSLTSLDVSSFDTSNTEKMYWMFANCSSLTSLDLTSFDTSNVKYFQNMFNGCTNLKEIKVSRSKWVIKSGCTTTDMFKNCGCSKVTYVD